jgi:tRNA1Val (adenine37-N6)-methyltransferase
MSEDSIGKKAKKMSMIAEKSSPVCDQTTSLKQHDETLDVLYAGKLKLFQGRNGYRFSLDALLLAHFMTCRRGEKIADLGTGNGVIALTLAYLHSSLSITGVEIQPRMVDRATRNVWMNGFQERIAIARADVRNIQKTLRPESFAAVVCNPPYRRTTSGRTSPNVERKIARHEIAAGLADFLCAAAFLLPIKGRIAMVYPAFRVVDLLQSLRNMNLEPKRLRMVHSFADTEASVVLVEAVKGGRSGNQTLSPLIVYREGKYYTAELQAMLAGKPTLD